ncbi:MAG: alpha-galactosidase [Armatimonadetes bacterium]|nr:alpha-galactosidase [Armatimonadota bacterium]
MRTMLTRNGVMALVFSLSFCSLPSPSATAQTPLEAQIATLPKLASAPKGGDWLIAPPKQRSGLFQGVHKHEVALDNGLIRRTFRLAPNAATVGFDNLTTRTALLRGVKPEAIVTLEVDGQPHTYAIGGLNGQPDYAYLRREWLDGMTSDPTAFQFTGFEMGIPKPRMEWSRKRYSSNTQYPPAGVSLTLHFAAPVLTGLKVSVHYELYDGIPLISKWLTLENKTGKPVRLKNFTSEILAAAEYESIVERVGQWGHPNIHVESDYAFIGMDPKSSSKAVFWVPDPQYTTQVNYLLQTPCQLECRPPLGPDMPVGIGETFETFRVWELVFDSEDRERKSLSLRRMYRTLAPWATENPILMHSRQSDPTSVKRVIDQCAEVGFEMVILSFGSGFDMENENPKYLAGIKALADYAHSKGIELGGYSLLASRRINDAEDAINPKTGKPGDAIFGNSPCLESRWGQDYFRKMVAFLEKTGVDILEHDGSYPGDVCASTLHPGHQGLEDSQWRQWVKIRDFYHWCRGRGVYLNVPDWYFLSGSNKVAMGYREVNWSLPRDRQLVLARQNIYDGTWYKTSSMGWMFVPLVEYQGGGEAATLEPLHEHLDTYGTHLAQNFLSGVQACYRGPRLYDTEETKAVVKKWVTLYKKHRAILDSDVIHLRRPDGNDYDGLLHVNPNLSEKGFAVINNPLHTTLETTITLPLYYTGLVKEARVRHEGGAEKTYRLNAKNEIVITVKIPAQGLTWFVIQ